MVSKKLARILLRFSQLSRKKTANCKGSVQNVPSVGDNGPGLTTEASCSCTIIAMRGWSGGAMVLGKLPVPGRPTIRITVGQGPTALAVGAGGGCLDIFTLVYLFSPLPPPPPPPSLGDGPI